MTRNPASLAVTSVAALSLLASVPLLLQPEASASAVVDLASIVRIDADSGTPVPVSAAPGHDLGERLIAELNCVACHTASDETVDRLMPRTAPLLGDVGRRLKPSWIRKWIIAPHEMKPGTTMPNLFTNLEPQMLDRVAEPITHFLVSLGGPAAAEEEIAQRDVEYGKLLYHQLGCVSCHAAFEGHDVFEPAYVAEARDTYEVLDNDKATEVPVFEGDVVPLAFLARKTTVSRLTEFLIDPLATHPAGRMPSLNLSDTEARAIASYLIETDRALTGGGFEEPDFVLDPAKVETGRTMFAAMGCAHCHEMGPNRTAIEPMARPTPIPDLKIIEGAADTGCIQENVPPGLADYNLPADQRDAIAAALADVDRLAQPQQPEERIVATMSALNCYACHERGGHGGPEPLRRNYFVTIAEAELGDEGRIPPPLTDVGAKLMPAWLNTVLHEGAEVRPYMATRMPVFGRDNLHGLADHLLDVDGAQPLEELMAPIPGFSEQLVQDGRRLTGTTGFACIQCHTIAGRDSIGEPALDLATSHERLQPKWFRSYMHDPAALRPGTRMPQYWPEGQVNPFPEIQGGDPDRQIDALWAYYSLGSILPLPEGLPTGDEGYELVVTDKPVFFRTFIEGAGVRAVAVGYPERVNIAFDSDQVRLALAWRGQFLSAAGAWAGRGGLATDPLGEDVLRLPDGPAFSQMENQNAPWPRRGGKEGGYRSFGYRLDAEDRPAFGYRYNTFNVIEQPLPLVRQGAPGLTRSMIVRPTVEQPDPLYFRAATGGDIEPVANAEHTWLVEGAVTIAFPELPDGLEPFVRTVEGGQELIVRLDPAAFESGHVTLITEYSWND